MRTAVVCLLTALMAGITNAAPEPKHPQWTEGQNYIVLPTSSTQTTRGARVQVIEAFSYTCVHCFRFEPHIQSWLRTEGKEIAFTRIHSQWSPMHQALARLYYTLRTLHRSDLDPFVFEEIHIKKNRLFSETTEETLKLQLNFAVSHGISRADFERVYQSEQVDKELKAAQQQLTTYRVEGTPSLIIDGRYLADVGHASKDGASEEENMDRLLQLAGDLVALEQAQSIKIEASR